MKKHLLFGFLLISVIGFSQEFEVTKNGLKDKENLENDYLVISTHNKSTEELYENAI